VTTTAIPGAASVRTREEWLLWGVDQLRPRFAAAKYELPKLIHVSVGFPSRGALSMRRRVVGQCWGTECSADGACHVFISPLLATGPEALDVLVHELVHVVTPGTGHRAPFVAAGKAVGLTDGKPISLGAGPELLEVLQRLNAESPYPHSALSPTLEIKKQGTRMVKVQCDECEYVCRVTRKWIDAVGAPLCPVHGQMEEVTV